MKLQVHNLIWLDIHAGQNGWRLIERPVEHVTTTHPYTDEDFIENSSNQNKNKKANESAALEDVNVKKVVTIVKERIRAFDKSVLYYIKIVKSLWILEKMLTLANYLLLLLVMIIMMHFQNVFVCP